MVIDSGRMVLLAGDLGRLDPGGDSLLRRRSLDIHQVGSAAELLGALHGSSAGLVLLAGELPDRTLGQVCQDIRNDPRLCKVSILAIVPPSEANMRAELTAAGANAVLSLPLELAVFENTIGRLLEVAVRREFRSLVRIRTENGSGEFLGTTVNISITGMLLEAAHFLEVGHQVTLRCTFPRQDKPCVLKAAVVREERVGDQSPRYGLEFLQMPHAAQTAIAHLKEH